jgi:hypothetical protein
MAGSQSAGAVYRKLNILKFVVRRSRRRLEPRKTVETGHLAQAVDGDDILDPSEIDPGFIEPCCMRQRLCDR